MNALVPFYEGSGTDHRGRKLAEIQQWTDETLESEHDFIQWLFPLPERSPVNPQAPLLDPETLDAFAHREDLRLNLQQSFQVMLQFYGFELLDPPPTPQVRPSSRFSAATRNWLSPGNHNHLRITRILRSLSLLGLPAHARAFFNALSGLYQTDQGRRAISPTSFDYWKRAVNEP